MMEQPVELVVNVGSVRARGELSVSALSSVLPYGCSTNMRLLGISQGKWEKFRIWTQPD